MGASLFGPDSMMWRINRESILLLGGRAALLMQLAHPLVAAGVADYSAFRSDPIGRLRRTLDVMLTIVFGEESVAVEAARKVNSLHDRIAGVAADGTPYRAKDPQLLLWVNFTLVDSSLRVYEACVATLSDGERDRYYEETKIVARLFDIPEEIIPPTISDLREWANQKIASREVTVTPTARALAEPILRPIRLVPWRLAAASAFITAALLPAQIREGYGLRLSRPATAALAAGRQTSRRLLPLVPPALRTFPAARSIG
ncbi:MAG: oxygenase MpaB family protein [Actinomycetota bacterium]